MARPAKSIKIQMIEGNTNNKTREEITKRAKAEEKFDVVTDGDFIEKGNKIEVVRVEGMRIVVRKI